MIKIKFKSILEQHRFTIQIVHEGTGLHRNTLTDLMYGRTQRIDLETLNKLCKYFRNYFPSFSITDLIEYIDD